LFIFIKQIVFQRKNKIVGETYHTTGNGYIDQFVKFDPFDLVPSQYEGEVIKIPKEGESMPQMMGELREELKNQKEELKNQRENHREELKNQREEYMSHIEKINGETLQTKLLIMYYHLYDLWSSVILGPHLVNNLNKYSQYLAEDLQEDIRKKKKFRHQLMDFLSSEEANAKILLSKLNEELGVNMKYCFHLYRLRIALVHPYSSAVSEELDLKEEDCYISTSRQFFFGKKLPALIEKNRSSIEQMITSLELYLQTKK